MAKVYSNIYPAIDNLLCCYFNPDWNDDYDSPEAVIRSFAIMNERNWVEQSITEFKTLLKENHTKAEWYQLISDDFGCEYSLRLRNIEPTDWLKKVQKQLENELAKKSKE